jgi:hypothetical protein
MLTTIGHAQVRCATDEIENKALLKNPKLRTDFELWMKNKVAEKNLQSYQRNKTNSTYTIPVVVHILHNGEPVGTGLNISDAQVFSQMRVLNADYNRTNADAVNTPAEFASVASSIDIEFVLAKQDPDGLPTTGITRTLASKNGYTVDDNAEIKSQAYWPAEDYFNIWVVNMTDTYLGYAQFPVTSLQGTTPPYDRLTDGVVIHYKAFGSIEDGSFNLLAKYNLGRTTTHETGHYLGLLHVFGDFSSCNTTDYVDDTPVQKDRTFSCPSGPLTGCNHHVMYQNFLDYTDDACMNLFTADQIARIQTVLDNSPRRASLLTSDGAIEPVVLNLDLEAKNIAAPFTITCGQSIVPKVVIRNRGNTKVTSAKINLVVNGSTLETRDFSLNLNNLDQQTLAFNAINLVEPSTNNVSFNILQVNGIADDDTGNNSAAVVSQVSAPINAPYTEAFNTTPANWQIVNPDNGTTWKNVTAAKSTASNKAMYLDFYDYQNPGAKDQLISPFINVPNDDALMKFDHAYAMFPNTTTESLRILVAAGCSTDLANAVEVYNKSGSLLATANNQQTAFTPQGESQWRTEGVSLSAYSGQTIRLIFEATNANGNNLYLDNVQVSSGELNDVKVVSIVSPGPVFCEQKPKPVIAVQNLGTTTVNRLVITTEVNGITSASDSRTNLAMTPGAMINVELSALNLTQANNSIKFTITDPDALLEISPNDNSLTVTRIFNTQRDVVPSRQNFDNSVASWTIFSEGASQKWVGTNTKTYNNGLVFKAYSDATLTDESWFVSPVLDFTKASEGSLLFTTSYGVNLGKSETLKVLVSKDCGITYDEVVFEKSGQDLSNKTVSTEWVPNDETDWTTQYVSTNDFAGKDKIRFAFVAENDHGNDIYLDNIEFFIEDNPAPPRTTELFAVYNSETNPYEFKITFNLPEKQDARLVIYNSLGQLLIDSELPGALNQTYTVNLYGQSTGVYVAKLQTSSKTEAVKLFLGK